MAGDIVQFRDTTIPAYLTIKSFERVMAKKRANVNKLLQLTQAENLNGD